MAYADDIGIFCKELRQVGKMLKCIRDSEKTTGIQLNNKKSAILKICKRNKKINPEKDFFRQIPYVNSYKYLGLNIDYKLNFNLHLQILQEKLNKIVQRTFMFDKKIIPPKFF